MRQRPSYVDASQQAWNSLPALRRLLCFAAVSAICVLVIVRACVEMRPLSISNVLWLGAMGAACAVIWVVQVDLFRRRRRILALCCPTCGHDLPATGDRCPECGTVVGKEAP